ncbi:phosphomannomutase/phosphoglucomutase [Myxococcota bacterium]|nr:phosphomannomutase/phosphoglucomutase [Myxococcota bacterium]MBU1497671.1 phosphomannomutase/phosphoglucomutase [Myxococcota bacterium]
MGSPFHAYDVRGLYPSEIDEDLAWKFGRAFMDIFDPPTVVVGHDMRPSSGPLHEALITSLKSLGARIIDLGLISTDMMYIAVLKLQADAGLMITASHNPARYNGIKTVLKNAVPLGLGYGLEKIKDTVEKDRSHCSCSFSGTINKLNFMDEFVETVFDLASMPTEMPHRKIAIDAGNGMGGLVLPGLIERLDIETKNLYFEPDGTFPNHEANPMLEENRKELQETVLADGSDFGFAPDGDFDRGFFIDNHGRFINGDIILGFLSELELREKPKSIIAMDVRCSRWVSERIRQFGGTPMMVKVGHAHAKRSMAQAGAVFGGEVSGHYYYQGLGGYFDSGSLVFLKFLKLLAKKDMQVSEILDLSSEYHLSGEINISVGQTDVVMEHILQKFGNEKKVIKIDGIRIEDEDYWFSLRASNTEPLMRINVEASTESKMCEIRDLLIAEIQRFQDAD